MAKRTPQHSLAGVSSSPLIGTSTGDSSTGTSHSDFRPSRNWSCVPPLINEPFNTSSSLLRPPQDPFLHRRSVSDPFGSSMPLPTFCPMASGVNSPSITLYFLQQLRCQLRRLLDKLQNIYKEHASDFWSNIAAKYSGIAQLTILRARQAFFNARPTDEGYFDLPPIGNVSSSRSDASYVERTVAGSGAQLSAYEAARCLRLAALLIR